MESNVETKSTKKKRNPVFLIILAVIVIVGGWYGISKYQYSQHNEDTDDAQIGADISPVIPRVAGYITDIRVRDNQNVKKGDTLLVLDNKKNRTPVGIVTTAAIMAFYSKQKQKDHQYDSPNRTRRLMVQGRKLVNKMRK